MRLVFLAVAALGMCGCGYIGDPLPPLRNIPTRVSDLAVVQHGDRLVAVFTVPQTTTEGSRIKTPPTLDLRVGPAPPGEFDTGRWADAAQKITKHTLNGASARYEIPISAWRGKDVIVAVRVVGSNGRDEGWSNLVSLTVNEPLAPPRNLRVSGSETGVRLQWEGAGEAYRIYRRAGEEKDFSRVAETQSPSWDDTTTQYGKTYHYKVQAVKKSGATSVESEPSDEASVTPKDEYPPAAPVHLTGVVSPGAVDLLWEPNTEPDFAMYRVYRAKGSASWERIAEAPAPAFTDHPGSPGTAFRYAVTAVDKNGNESKQSNAIDVTAQ